MGSINVKSGVARNTVWMLFGQASSLVIQALYFIEIARSLGAANYGAFVGVVALVGIAVPFGDLGSGGLLVKNVSRDNDLFPHFWGGALVSVGASASVLVLTLLLVSRFVLPPSIPLRLVLLVSASDLFGLNVIQICAQAFQAFDLLKWTAAVSAMANASRLISATILISVRPTPSALQWGYAYFCSTAAVVGIVVWLVSSKLGLPKMRSRISPKQIREGLYFSISLSAQTVYNDIDKTMLARLGTLEATGIYGAAYRLIAVSFVPVASLLTASYANFFRAGANGVSACLAYARPLMRRALWYSVLACVALLLSAGLVPHVLGGEYAKTTEALRWLALLPAFKATSYFYSNALTGAGYQALRSGIQVGVAVFNVLINLWIIPLYSWRGAAWSSLASDGLLAAVTCAAALMLASREAAEPFRVDVPAPDVSG